jgi:lipopolysaccharide export system protein LptA
MKQHKNISPSRLLLIAVYLAYAAYLPTAYAEKADSQKETVITAESSQIDNKKNISVLTGDVILTKGTLIVKGSRAIVTDLGGHKYSVQLFSSLNKLANFRQKRDGGENLWIEGEAERIEYNDTTEEVKFISKAKVRNLDGKKITEEQEGEFLSYDSLNEVFFATNNTSGKAVPGAGRIKVTLQPKPEKPVN